MRVPRRLCRPTLIAGRRRACEYRRSPSKTRQLPDASRSRRARGLSTATHNVDAGHEIPFSWMTPSITPGVHSVELAGVVVESRLPWLSTAKHSAVVGHDTDVSS